jgi:signal transduction histidine kinase
LANYDSLSDTLVDMGIYEGVEKFVPLFIHPESQFIIQTCYELSGIVRNINNMNLAVGKASKMVYALKSYSHYNQIDKPIEVDVTEGIDTVLALYHNNIKHGIELVKNYGNIPKISCLPDELNQVWTNLIYNSLQAMDYNGILEIETRQNGDYIEVKITDNGKGIPDNIKDRIFEPFFTTKPQGEGSGLGLGIVQKIINKHKGQIYFESIPGETSFTIKLPIKMEI